MHTKTHPRTHWARATRSPSPQFPRTQQENCIASNTRGVLDAMGDAFFPNKLFREMREQQRAQIGQLTREAASRCYRPFCEDDYTWRQLRHIKKQAEVIIDRWQQTPTASDQRRLLTSEGPAYKCALAALTEPTILLKTQPFEPFRAQDYSSEELDIIFHNAVVIVKRWRKQLTQTLYEQLMWSPAPDYKVALQILTMTDAEIEWARLSDSEKKIRSEEAQARMEERKALLASQKELQSRKERLERLSYEQEKRKKRAAWIAHLERAQIQWRAYKITWNKESSQIRREKKRACRRERIAQLKAQRAAEKAARRYWSTPEDLSHSTQLFLEMRRKNEQSRQVRHTERLAAELESRKTEEIRLKDASAREEIFQKFFPGSSGLFCESPAAGSKKCQLEAKNRAFRRNVLRHLTEEPRFCGQAGAFHFLPDLGFTLLAKLLINRRLVDPFCIDFKSALNPEQYDAVTAADGPALVLAGAGSGKTRTLTYRVAYLISQGVKPSEILLLTFTNKASKEMLSRVEDLTGIPGHHFWGGTFHHIGQKTLRFWGESIGVRRDFTILDQSDAEALLTDCIREDNPAFLKGKDNPKPRVLAEIISFARNTQVALEDVLEDKYEYLLEFLPEFKKWAERYTAVKMEKQTLDYDDLLEHWLVLLKSDEAVRVHFQGRFRHILVDEYQDTNCLQSAIIDTLAARHQIMAVGDDAQCIYTWRGASFENILTFPERHPDTQIHKIQTNYRSSPEILALANEVLRREVLHQAYRKELRAVRPCAERPLVVACYDTRDQAAYIAREIRLLHADGMSFQQIGVLYRAHFQAMDLQMELSKQGIPYTITSGVRFFEQAHVRDLVAQLRFAFNSADTVAFLRIASLLPKVGPRTAEKALEMAADLGKRSGKTLISHLGDESILTKVPAEAREHWTALVLTLLDIEEALRPPKLAPIRTAAQQADLFAAPLPAPGAPKAEIKPPVRLKPATPAEAVETAVEGWYGDFIKTLHANWISRREDLESLVAFAQRFETMGELLSQLVLLNSETTERGIEPQEDCVRLTTVHQAKGLEYPAVFVIGAADGLFPLERAVDEDNVDEERRLFYVAVTRAQEKLYITFPKLSFVGGPPTMLEPSRFLQELPEAVYEMVSYKGNAAARDFSGKRSKGYGSKRPAWSR